MSDLLIVFISGITRPAGTLFREEDLIGWLRLLSLRLSQPPPLARSPSFQRKEVKAEVLRPFYIRGAL